MTRWFRKKNKLDKDFEELNNQDLPENMDFAKNKTEVFAS